MKHKKAFVKKLVKSLSRCLREAEESLYYANGAKPSEIIGYDGWADNARNLIKEYKNANKQPT